MPRHISGAGFRPYSAGIFACCCMIGLVALLLGSLLYGTGYSRPVAEVIVGEPRIIPERQLGAPPDSEEPASQKIVIRQPASLDKLSKTERSVADASYALKVFAKEGGAFLGGGSGFVVGPDTLVTAAHVTGYDTDNVIVRVFCIERDDGLLGYAEASVLDLDATLDVSILNVTGCPDTEPVTLAEELPDANDRLHTYGFSLATGFNILDGDHRKCSFIPGADAIKGMMLGGETIEPLLALISPNVVGITSVCECGNSGGPVFRSGDGAVVGMIVVRDPQRSRSFMVPASSIREVLERAGR